MCVCIKIDKQPKVLKHIDAGRVSVFTDRSGVKSYILD